MSLGNSLFNARKKRGLSQEEVAGKLGVSRQTISKWELDETLPDIRQSKKLANLYGMTLDELIEFDMDVKEIQEIIDRTNDAVTDKIDWTKAWSKKYPVLAVYQKEVDVQPYGTELNRLLADLEKKYGYSELNAFLVLKDILAGIWKQRRVYGTGDRHKPVGCNHDCPAVISVNPHPGKGTKQHIGQHGCDGCQG